jgi:quinol monooxygenase YgiN
MAIVRINDFRAAPGQAAALREFLTAVIDVIETSPGCQAVQLLVDPEDATRLVVVETWDSVASHQAAAASIPPEQLAQVRPLLAGPPSGRFYERIR